MVVQIQSEEQARVVIEATARASYGKLLAFLVSRTRDVPAAEDALAEAFATALTEWPVRGCPANPVAWLLTVARRKAIDASRRVSRVQTGVSDDVLGEVQATGVDGEHIPDRRLALLFACAHPAIDLAVRAPLMLQTVLGLDAAAIGSAFLVAPATMGQRLVRAKQKIRQAGVPFRVPEPEQLGERLTSVLDAIYAAYAEGWSDPMAADPARRDLAVEAIFLGRLVVNLLPAQPEALGLLALMLHSEARRHARRLSNGEYVPLSAQDPAKWDATLIVEAERLLRHAGRLSQLGRYQLEGALQSAHVHRRRTGEDNWREVVAIYDALLTLSPSPVVVINRALAVAEVEGPAAALPAVEALAADPRMSQFQPFWAARADLLARTGAQAAARSAYQRAIGLERDPAVRRFLQARMSSVTSSWLVAGPEGPAYL